ncbi:MAG: glycogen/starch/alpha-glucan phosphorylase, partial [Elusimicrobia bacterium]|nr:glycogen/starch/alpha-glucan phosphorylase [Elusimicrobiota bacterium]
DEQLLPRFRAGATAASANVAGHEYAAVAGRAAAGVGNVPLESEVEERLTPPFHFVGPSPLKEAVLGVGQKVRALAAAPSFAGASLQMTGWFSRLLGWFGVSPETAARLSFLEEIVYFGGLLIIMPFVPASAPLWIKPAIFIGFQLLFALGHGEYFTWTADGRIQRQNAGAGTFITSLVMGSLFRSAFFFNVHPMAALGIALLAHALWNNAIAPLLRFLPVLMTAPRGPPDESTWTAENTPNVADKTIVEVTMEMALSGKAFERMTELGIDHDMQVAAAMATSTGGIGPLLKERVIALGDLGAKAIGFSLLYEHVWVQKIEKYDDGRPDRIWQEKVKVGDAFRKILEPAGEIELPMAEQDEHNPARRPTVKVKVWKSPPGMYGKSTVYFFDNPQVADVVYPGNADAPGYMEGMRRMQNWIVGRGSLAMLKKLNVKPDITVMSEMPSTLSMHKLAEDDFTHDPFFKDTLYVFNDHTPLEYAHPHWDASSRTKMALRPRFYENQDLWVWNAQDREWEVDGTAMVINAADAVYGVAQKHGVVMRSFDLLKQFAAKIKAITNGVSGSYWPTDEFKDPDAVAAMSDPEIAGVKTRRRNDLFRFLEKRARMPQGWAERMIAAGKSIGIWTRRIVGYKRMDLFATMLEDPAARERFIKAGIVFVIGGRIHQDDNYGINQFNRIQEMMRQDPRLKDLVIFFDNYNILEAPKLMQGADFAVMLADDGREASATGFQKAQMNGALIICSHDGATPESVWDSAEDNSRANGFKVPYVFAGEGKAMTPTAGGLLTAFERFAEARSNPAEYGRMVRNALKAAPFVDVKRTAKDMLRFFSEAVTKRDNVNAAYQEGRDIARAVFDDHPMDQDAAARAIAKLEEAPKFSWTYKERGVTPRALITNGHGIEGFLEGEKYVREIGTVGEWSMAFHASNHAGAGDIVTYLRNAVGGAPELAELLAAINALGDRALAATNIDDKVRLGRVAVGLIEEALARLKRIRDGEQPAPAIPSAPTGGRFAWFMAAFNLMDVGARLVFDTARNIYRVVYNASFERFRRDYLPNLPSGISAVYLYGGFWQKAPLGVKVHTQPDGTPRVVTSGPASVHVHEYPGPNWTLDLSRAALKVAADARFNPDMIDTAPDGQLLGDRVELRNDKGNPFATRRAWVTTAHGPRLRINPALAQDPTYEGAAREAYRLIEAIHERGIQAVTDFIGWLSPDDIDASNYKMTFYRELSPDDARRWESLEGRPQERDAFIRELHEREADVYVNGRWLRVKQNDYYAVVRIAEGAKERPILVRHLSTPGYGANKDQVVLNILNPETQRYYKTILRLLIDLGIDGARIDLGHLLLLAEQEQFALNPHGSPQSNTGAQEHYQRDRADYLRVRPVEPIRDIMADATAYARGRKRQFTFFVETYDEHNRRTFRDLGAVVYQKDPLDNFLEYMKRKAENPDPRPDQTGRMREALDWMRAALYNAWDTLPLTMIFPSNFDEQSVLNNGGPWQSFVQLQFVLGRMGVPLMMDNRELRGARGHKSQIPGWDHPPVSNEDLGRQLTSSVKQEYETSPVAQQLETFLTAFSPDGGTQAGYAPHEKADILNTSAQFRYVAIGGRYSHPAVTDDQWFIVAADFMPEHGHDVMRWVEAPRDFVQEKGLAALASGNALTPEEERAVREINEKYELAAFNAQENARTSVAPHFFIVVGPQGQRYYRFGLPWQPELNQMPVFFVRAKAAAKPAAVAA